MTEVDALCWNRLIQHKDPFLRHEFLLALEQSGAVSPATGWVPQHLLIFEQQELLAAMPLYLKDHSRGEYVFDQQWADAYYQSGMDYYPKWLNAIPFSPCSGQRLLIQEGLNNEDIIAACLDHIKQLSALNNISSLHCLFPLPEQSDLLAQHLMVREAVQFHWFNKDYRDFDDYLQSFTSRQRKNVKKERRKVTEQGLQRFDSGAQGEHKISRGFEPISTYSSHWIQNTQFAKLITQFLERETELTQQYKQDCRQNLPFK